MVVNRDLPEAIEQMSQSCNHSVKLANKSVHFFDSLKKENTF
jgi:hypothetical protein